MRAKRSIGRYSEWLVGRLSTREKCFAKENRLGIPSSEGVEHKMSSPSLRMGTEPRDNSWSKYLRVEYTS